MSKETSRARMSTFVNRHDYSFSKEMVKAFFNKACVFRQHFVGRIMTPSQCRAARGLLNWTQDEMASAAHLSVVTVRNFENEKSTPQRATLDVIQRALEAAGVDFTNGEQPGVRLTKTAAAQPAEPARVPNPTGAVKIARRKTAKATERKR
jgi:transcriptional regulator with XRE-family HTH domain